MDIGESYDITRDLQFEYTILPDQVLRWRQWKIHQDAEVLVSAFYDPELPRPLKAGDRTIVEGTFYGISYNFWDQWFNVISVYDEDLVFKGYYTDILTPIQKTWNVVTATDLFLDLFMAPDGSWSVEDEEEFEAAIEKGLIDDGIARGARSGLEKVIARAEADEWPPECVKRIPSNPVATLRSVKQLGQV
jgi:predicted RNA-binding protein associated with RNAse of E/G family